MNIINMLYRYFYKLHNIFTPNNNDNNVYQYLDDDFNDDNII